MRRANKSLRTACRTKPDTIRNWSILVLWRKQAFLTTLNQNSVSCRLHLTLTCIYLGRSAHVVPILPAAWEGPGNHAWPGTVWDWGMFSEEQTHPPSLHAASVGWSFPLAAWPTPMGILLQVQQLLGETQPAPGLTCIPPVLLARQRRPGEGPWCPHVGCLRARNKAPT